MIEDGLRETKTGYFSSLLSLFASSSTLICCAMPALLVSLGAGATLASLVAIFPKIVWISEHKEVTFLSSAALMLLVGYCNGEIAMHHARLIRSSEMPALKLAATHAGFIYVAYC